MEERLIKYIKIAYWMIIILTVFIILFYGTEQLVNLILRKNLHIYWSDLEMFISIIIAMLIMWYWNRLHERYRKAIDLIYEIERRYEITDKITKERSSSEEKSARESWDLISIEMDIKLALEYKSKFLC